MIDSLDDELECRGSPNGGTLVPIALERFRADWVHEQFDFE